MSEPEKRRGSGEVPIPIEVLEHELHLDVPRREPIPDDDTPTNPDVLEGICVACKGVESKMIACKRCKGTGFEQ
jgi:hypothetical protein